MPNTSSNPIEKFFRDQLSVWTDAAANFRSLKAAETRDLKVNGLKVRLQHNPGRIKSSTAKVDTRSLKARACFLCSENRPAEQRSLLFEGRKGRKYDILINPYPIFRRHLVVASVKHEPQSIEHRLGDITDLARHFTDYTFFYNGPKCGASAPDHLHFQACPRAVLPLECEIDTLLDGIALHCTDGGVPNGEESAHVPEELSESISYVASVQEAQLFHYKKFTRGVFALRARTSKSLAKLFFRFLDCVPAEAGQEPMLNLMVYYKPPVAKEITGVSHGRLGEYRAIVTLRAAHRSHHYFSEGDDHLTMSPGCADMAGLFIVPNDGDYAKLNAGLLEEVLSEVSVSEKVESEVIWRMTRTQSKVQVGIMSGQEIQFEIISDGAGRQSVSYEQGKISYNGCLYDELYFDARTMSSMFAEPTFILYGVTIGIGFHWERKMDLRYAGSLKFIVTGNKVTAINVVGIEDYLLSVISSEMKASASLELLKAHAVISRSWLIRQIQARRAAQLRKEGPYEGPCTHNLAEVSTYLDNIGALRNDAIGLSDGNAAVLEETPFGDAIRKYADIRHLPVSEVCKWFDHSDHRHFDVCADDHCQRYQGTDMVTEAKVRQAIDMTWGQVLACDGEVCDARFSKCCGGVTERFGSCWEDKDYGYLARVVDAPDADSKSFCDTDDEAVLSQILNDYDLETKDFYRWRVEYSRSALSKLTASRSGVEIGELAALLPLQRGVSGRIVSLAIVGSKAVLVAGKELIIRKYLSESHLKSSAFDVHCFRGDTELTEEEILRCLENGEAPEFDRMVLEGRGWGHGVGLCQIGASVMATQGYDYKAILSHYYPGSSCAQMEDLPA